MWLASQNIHAPPLSESLDVGIHVKGSGVGKMRGQPLASRELAKAACHVSIMTHRAAPPRALDPPVNSPKSFN
jgi:hypothetical protein